MSYDDTCDYCGRQVGLRRLRLVRIGRSSSWLCDDCKARQEERYAIEVAAEDSAEARWKEVAYR